jgi:hypothetical protein
MQHPTPTLTPAQRVTVLKAIRSLDRRVQEAANQNRPEPVQVIDLRDRLEIALATCYDAAEGKPTYLTTGELDALRSVLTSLA